VATNQQVLDALAALSARIDALTPAPVATGKPAKAKATSPAFGGETFETYVEKRRAAALPCGIPEHGAACNRTFSPKSSGRTDHTARLITRG